MEIKEYKKIKRLDDQCSRNARAIQESEIQALQCIFSVSANEKPFLVLNYYRINLKAL